MSDEPIMNEAAEPEPQRQIEPGTLPTLSVGLTRAQIQATPDLVLWHLIKRSSDNMSFENYQAFIDFILCGKPLPKDLAYSSEGKRIVSGTDEDTKAGRYIDIKKRRSLPFTNADAYRLLKIATEAFVAVNCGVLLGDDTIGPDIKDVIDDIEATGNAGVLLQEYLDDYLVEINGGDKTLPYLALILNKLPDSTIKTHIFRDYQTLAEVNRGSKEPNDCLGVLQHKFTQPCLIELIWSHWLEQGYLVQTINAVSRRFQNIRGTADHDPLALVRFDPLRPLNNLLWGYIQDEQHRLSVVRRAYEYDHHYSLTLEGKAVPHLQSADSRSRFLESFHLLLNEATAFYRQDDDTTVRADGFPILNALKDLHMLLSEGADNQFGDLPATARIEMLMQQWLLARPEFRDVLPTPIMVAYPEPWMERVDAMKKLQGWGDTSIMHFRDLAVYGEQILLSVRFGAWTDDPEPGQAAVWARFWRAQIQGYIHAYRTVTGVDLTADMTQLQARELVTMQPSTLLKRRLPSGRSVPALPAGTTPALPPFKVRRALRKAKLDK